MHLCPDVREKSRKSLELGDFFHDFHLSKFQHKVLETRSSTMPELVVGRTAQAPAVGGLSGHPVIQCDWIRGRWQPGWR